MAWAFRAHGVIAPPPEASRRPAPEAAPESPGRACTQRPPCGPPAGRRPPAGGWCWAPAFPPPQSSWKEGKAVMAKGFSAPLFPQGQPLPGSCGHGVHGCKAPGPPSVGYPSGRERCRVQRDPAQWRSPGTPLESKSGPATESVSLPLHNILSISQSFQKACFCGKYYSTNFPVCLLPAEASPKEGARSGRTLPWTGLPPPPGGRPPLALFLRGLRFPALAGDGHGGQLLVSLQLGGVLTAG